MQNFQGTFETRKRSFISAFSICMTFFRKKELRFIVLTLFYCLSLEIRLDDS